MTDRIEVRGTTRVDVRHADAQVENRGTVKIEIRDGGLPGVTPQLNLFIQQTQPTPPASVTEYLWIQTDGAGGVVTFWVET